MNVYLRLAPKVKRRVGNVISVDVFYYCDMLRTKPLGMRRSGGSCGNAYMQLHAKLFLASGATHMRTKEQADTNSAGRDHYVMIIYLFSLTMSGGPSGRSETAKQRYS